MSSRNLIIYNYRALYNVLSEISSNLNFETTFVDNENSLKDKISNLNDYMVLSNKNYPDHINLFVLSNLFAMSGYSVLFAIINKCNCFDSPKLIASNISDLSSLLRTQTKS